MSDRLSVFVASPSDVKAERLAAYRLIERLNREFADSVELHPLLWEHEPLLATQDFQSQIGRPSESDVFVLIVGSRLGSPLAEHYTRADGSRYASATEYEFEEAMEASRATGQPKVLVYRKTPLPHAATNELLAVDRFFDKWFRDPDDQTATAAYHSFSETARFEDLLEIHLRKLLRDHLPPPNNLPASIDEFVGRAELRLHVSDLLRNPDSRLIALVGPGGVGKTRLALEAGRDYLTASRDGAFFVSLATIVDPDLVPDAIARALELPSPDNLDQNTVLKHLKNTATLLIIDNLEQVQSAAGFLGEILAQCPRIRMIVTSRETLRLKGTNSVAIPPLSLPRADDAPQVADLADNEAVRLFVRRAQQADHTFELTSDNAQAVVEVCRQVDALPLAIELAASRIHTMSPSRLSRALDQRFRLLRDGSADLHRHQRSLRELIQWSYELLDPSEQTLWRRLSVFADGCTIEAAQEVCDPDGEYLIELDVESLANKSLVLLESDERLGPRLRMLESLKAYAREELARSAEYDRIRQLFCAWCVRIGSPDGSIFDRTFETRLGQMTTEQNNVRGALEFAIGESNSELALRLCIGMYQFWYTTGQFEEGTRWIRRSLAVVPAAASEYRAKALRGLGLLLREQQKLDEAERCVTDAMAIFEALSDQGNIVPLLGELGVIALRRQRLDQATDYLDQCIELANDAGISGGPMSFYFNAKGVIEHVKGNLESAKAMYVEALATGRSAGDRIRSATALLNLGEILETEGRHEEALAHYRDSLETWSDTGHKEAIARCAEVIAGLQVRCLDNPTEAAFLFGAAEAIRDQIEVPVEPYNEQQVASDTRLSREKSAPDGFAEAWRAGKELGLDGVLRRTLEPY